MEVMVAATIVGYFKGRDAKELFYDLGIFVWAAFVTELLESFGGIMVVGNWVTLLVWF